MSKGGGKTSTTSVQSVDPEFKERALDIYDRAQTVADRPYTPIIGELTPAQQASAFNIFRAAGELPAYLTEARGATRSAASALYGPQFGEASGIVRGASAMPSVREAQSITRGALDPTEYGEAQGYARQGATYQPGTISAGMATYANPYEADVVQTALSDIERSRQLATQQGAAQAARARAFGGSRQGVAEAETNRAALEQAARTSAQLRQQGFITAGEMAARDIGFGLQGAQQRLAAAQQLGALTQARQAGQFTGAGQIGQLGLAGTQSELARASALAGMEEARARAAQQEAQFRLAQGQQLGNLALAGAQGQIGAQQASFNAQEALRANEEARRAEAFGYPERQLQILQQALGFFPNPITQTQTQRQTLGPMDIISRLGGTAATGASAYALLCWVAREVYGAENPRWLMFRHWVITDAPKWFLRLYIKYGEKFAAWISNKPTLKNAIRAFMDRKIQKKFGGGHV